MDVFRLTRRFLRHIGLPTIALFLLLSIALGGCGGSSSNSVTAPVIVSNPASQTVTAGSAVSFAVVATGSNLGYQWYRAGVAISGATGAGYTIPSAASSDGASYYVVVTNSAGSVQSSPAILTVTSVLGGTGGTAVTIQ